MRHVYRRRPNASIPSMLAMVANRDWHWRAAAHMASSRATCSGGTVAQAARRSAIAAPAAAARITRETSSAGKRTERHRWSGKDHHPGSPALGRTIAYARWASPDLGDPASYRLGAGFLSCHTWVRTGVDVVQRLDRILEHNRAFGRGRDSRPLPAVEELPLAVVACHDPRLDALIPESLGLAAGDAFLFRTAGAYLKPDGTAMRSLALAVYMFGVRDVIVLGHTTCRMAAFDTSAFIDAFRGRGVAREAFGAEDLRSWASAIPNPRCGAVMSVESIRAAPFLPKDLSVAGLVLDDTTGALEVVVGPDERAAILVEPPRGNALPEASTPAAARPPAPAAAPAPVAPPDPLAEAVHWFMRTIESSGGWREEIARLRSDLAAQRTPRAKLDLLERFARQVGAQSSEARSAFARVQREASAAGGLRDPQELLRLFDELTGGS